MPSRMRPVAVGLTAVVLTTAAFATTQPADTPREHRETLRAGRCEYVVTMGGNVDGVMTRDPIGYGGWRQTFEPNHEVVLTNRGPAVVKNPWLFVNGRGHWRNLRELVDRIVTPDMSDADKARALWEWHRHHRFHSSTGTPESSDAIKVYNVYGYTLCGNDSVVVADLWRAAGLKVRSGKPQGHSTSEVFYDGRWHLIDGDENIICLLPDNKTIACEDEIIRDHELMKRTHTYGILRADSRRVDETSAALHCHQDRKHGTKGTGGRHEMGFELRPGESMIWRWSNVHKWYGGDRYGSWKRVGRQVANGQLVYEPDFANSRHLRHLGRIENLLVVRLGGTSAYLRGSCNMAPARLTVTMRSPYVIVGGCVEADLRRDNAEDQVRAELSFDGKKWAPAWRADRIGDQRAKIDIDDQFPRTGPARYQVLVRFELKVGKTGPVGDVSLRGLKIALDLQMAPLTLPALALGQNRVTYTDETTGAREVTLTHRWVERSSWRRPAAPKIVSPRDGDRTASTRPNFRWQRPTHPDGAAIVDYQFQLSEYADLRWVLSPNFDKLIGRTAYRGKIPKTLADGYEPPYDGLLNPDQPYTWRVRARDARGVWGPWSHPATFVPQGPGVPIDLTADVDRAARAVTLRWKPNRKGRRPACYEVYGSDERGFSPSREPYDVAVEGSRNERFGTNLIATVKETKLHVVGSTLGDPKFNKVYYRVVAVDAKGVRSGPTGFVEAPHPMIVSMPPDRARVGRAYAYRPRVTRSIGHLVGYTAKGSSYNYGLRWGDDLTFAMPRGPTWLKLDAKTGQLSGTPPASTRGPITVELQVVSKLGGRDQQVYALQIGP